MARKKTPIVIIRPEESTTKRAWESSNPSPYMKSARKGVDASLVRRISRDKSEPSWMLQHRLESLRLFKKTRMPSFGPDLSHLNLDRITYYAKATERTADSWSDVPKDVKKTFDRLGIPQAEQKVLAGVGAQYESTVVYHRPKEKFAKHVLIF